MLCNLDTGRSRYARSRDVLLGGASGM